MSTRGLRDKMTAVSPPSQVSRLKLVGAGLYIAAWPALVLLLGGDWRWVEAWIFGVWFVGLSATAIVWLYRNDPALLAERFRKPGSGGQKGWDRWVVALMVATFMAWIVVMPLDARRFGWSPSLPVWLKSVGAALLVPSALLFVRAYTDNTFLSALVRIQTDRKHQVVSTGVYGFVRHPMYLGAVLMFVGVPLLLGSALGFGLTLVMIFLLAVRIVGEERMLADELEGYAEYRQRVRYRLIPLVW